MSDTNDNQPNQPNQRIWPITPPAQPLLRKLAEPARRALDTIAHLTTSPNIITTPDGVTFRPLSRTTLERALADTGPGHLDFAVTFPHSQHKRTRIRATRDRVFHDLPQHDQDQAHAFQALVHAAIAVVRPGDRALILGAGTGAITAAIAEHAGPSGAVTAFETDAQSVAFARARYNVTNAAHERLNTATLTGEPPEAAESIIVTPNAPERVTANPAELVTRLTRPGRLLLAGRHAAIAEALATTPGLTIERLVVNRTGFTTDSSFTLVRKPPAA